MKNSSLHKIFLLLKVQLSAQFGGKRRDKKQQIMLFMYTLLGVILCGYSFGLGYGLCMLKIPEVIPSYSLAVTGLITLFFTAVKTNGVIFGNRDYDILMSLPVRTSVVIASRFMTMYVMNVLFTALVMVPMGAAYVIWAAPGFLFYPVWICGILILPLIPTTLATVIGVVVIFFASRFKYANAVSTLLSILLLVGVLIFSFAPMGLQESQFAVDSLKSMGEFLLGTIHKLYPVSVLFYKAVVQYDMLAFLMLLVISLGWYFIFIKLVSLRYKTMNTGLMTYHVKADYKMTALKSSAPIVAICKKEWKRFFTSTVAVTNLGVGMIMALLLSGATMVIGVDKIMASLEISGMEQVALIGVPFLVVSCLGMSCTTSVSLSLEGKSLWIVKSLPVDTMTVYQGKILANLGLLLPVSILSSCFMVIGLKQGWLINVFLFLMPLAYCFFSSILGMMANVKLPNYEWTSETAVIKQSASSMIGMLGNMVNGFIPIVLVVIFLKNVNPLIIFTFFTVLESLLAFLVYRALKKTSF